MDKNSSEFREGPTLTVGFNDELLAVNEVPADQWRTFQELEKIHAEEKENLVNFHVAHTAGVINRYEALEQAAFQDGMRLGAQRAVILLSLAMIALKFARQIKDVPHDS